MNAWICPSCGLQYSYDLPFCTNCRSQLEEATADAARVMAITKVNTPSTGHEEIPYWIALTRSDLGVQSMVELDHCVEIGTVLFSKSDQAIGLAVVAILGTGVMGRSLAELFLTRGHRVVWCGRSEERLTAARDKLLLRLERVMNEEQVKLAASSIALCVGYSLLRECDVVIEAVIEELDPKAKTLCEAESHMRKDAVLATNTSGLSLDDLAVGLARPEKFGAMHFFNPATRMRLVETAVCSKTSAETSDFLDSFAVSLGKTPVRVASTPAFAVNRALMPLLNEAVRELQDGVASAAAIDEAIRLGLNHPMGPLALADLIGLDVVVDIMDNLAERTGDDTYAPRPMLRCLVQNGRLGRKTGAGFYDYVNGN